MAVTVLYCSSDTNGSFDSVGDGCGISVPGSYGVGEGRQTFTTHSSSSDSQAVYVSCIVLE